MQHFAAHGVTACQRCGYSEERRILIVHHKDGDRTNAATGNLSLLCPNCHALAHLNENGVSYSAPPRF